MNFMVKLWTSNRFQSEKRIFKAKKNEKGSTHEGKNQSKQQNSIKHIKHRPSRNIEQEEKLTGKQSRGVSDSWANTSSELILAVTVAGSPERRIRLLSGRKEEGRHGVGDKGDLIQRPGIFEVEIEVHKNFFLQLWREGRTFLLGFGHFLGKWLVSGKSLSVERKRLRESGGGRRRSYGKMQRANPWNPTVFTTCFERILIKYWRNDSMLHTTTKLLYRKYKFFFFSYF